MPTGLDIYNDYGTLQINEKYSNLLFMLKGTLTVSTLSDQYTYSYKAVLYVPGINPEIYINSAGTAYVAIGSKTPVSNGWNFTIYASSPVTLTYYVFDTNGLPSGNFGLQVFKEDRTLVYDSSCKVLQIVDIFSLGMPSSQRTYPTGKTYAARLTYSRQNIVEGPIVDAQMDAWTAITLDTFLVWGNTIYTQTGDTLIGVFPQPWYMSTPWAWGVPPQVIVADVTGY